MSVQPHHGTTLNPIGACLRSLLNNLASTSVRPWLLVSNDVGRLFLDLRFVDATRAMTVPCESRANSFRRAPDLHVFSQPKP